MAYLAICGGALATAALLLQGVAWRRRQQVEKLEFENLDYDRAQFRHFQLRYLIVMACALSCDWLSGSYTYKRYEEFGLSPTQINSLYLSGLVSSSLSGLVVGVLGDRFGRRKMCLFFALFECTAAALFLVNWLPTLVLHRVVFGLKSCIMWTCFEAWMVRHHRLGGFPEALLSNTFATTSLCNAICGVGCGVVASLLHEAGGTTAVALAPAAPASVLALVVWLFWAPDHWPVHPEQRQSPFVQVIQSLGTFWRSAYLATKADARICWVGITQMGLGAALTLFVVNWTPALPRDINHGSVFAVLMLAMTVGAAAIGAVGCDPRAALFTLLSTLTVAFIVAGRTSAKFVPFLVAEFAVGGCYPSIGALQAAVLPETVRATLASLYRVPLEGFSAAALLLSRGMPVEHVFLLGSAFTACGAVAAAVLLSYGSGPPKAMTCRLPTDGHLEPDESSFCCVEEGHSVSAA